MQPIKLSQKGINTMTQVLFVSHSKRGVFYYNDASARYRCVFPAEYMNEIGLQSHVVHFNQLSKINLQQYSHVVFHRPQYSLKLAYYIRTLKRHDITAIADFDDLLFVPELAIHSPAVLSGYMSLGLAKKHAYSYKKALQLFECSWVSTETLAKQMKSSQPKIQVTICHNKVPSRWATLQRATSATERLENKIIRYMPGTGHHRHDFQKIVSILAKVLNENPNIQLEVVGDLNFNTSDFPKDQISSKGHVPFEQLPEMIASSWLTLAPLENNLFNDCKSGLKFWESGLLGVPVISSPLADIHRFENTGLHISDNLDLWLAFIEKMKSLDSYLQASDNAKKSANAAVFGDSTADPRLASIQAQFSHIDPPEVDRNNQQLYMCATFGPRWPSIVLDPTHSLNVPAKNLAQNTRLFNKSIDDNSVKKLKESGASKTSQDGPTQKHILVRKLKKLWLAPADFFKDMRILNL